MATRGGFVRRLVPGSIRRLTRDLVGVTALQVRVERLETFLFESKEEIWERSRRRWRETLPTTDLTWGTAVTGDAFVAMAVSYHAFGAERSILEIGPGYGRLLKSILAGQIPFRRYCGVDISAKNIAYLKQNLRDERIDFIEGDIERITLEEKFDILISSLVLKHLFPSFAKALQNAGRYLNSNAILVFDLIEGNRTFFEDDNITYIRQYKKEEVVEILAGTGMELIAFDEVRHKDNQLRLLVVARKP